MIAGHFGLAAAVKSQERQVPLWALMLGTQWLDVLFIPLFIMGVETIVPAPGLEPGYGHAVIHADYTHSFVGALVLSAIFGLFFLLRWGRRTAVVLALMSFSHWILDLIVHRMDMPWLPGNAGNLPRLGFGLWKWPTAAAIVELILIVGGAWLYWRAARAVAAGHGPSLMRRADLAAAVVLVSGVIVLGLDVTGLAG
jgi:hypothetical protein